MIRRKFESEALDQTHRQGSDFRNENAKRVRKAGLEMFYFTVRDKSKALNLEICWDD